MAGEGRDDPSDDIVSAAADNQQERAAPDRAPASKSGGWLSVPAERLTACATVVMAGATIALVIATCAMVGVGYLQWKTLKTADTTQRIVQRPWISVKAITPIDPWPTYKGDKAGFRLRFFLKNVGHTPAFDVRKKCVRTSVPGS